MSFLIKDILQLNNDNCEKDSGDTSKTYNYTYLPSENCETNTNQNICNKSCSILEHTLTHTDNVYSYNVQQKYNYFTNYDLNTYGFGKTYGWKENFGSVYTREQLWTYVPHPMFTCAHLHGRRKGVQIRFTANQTKELEKSFAFHKYLCPKDRKQLADLLRLSDRQVKTWFQNRRAKWRRNNEDKHISLRLSYANGSDLEQNSVPHCQI